MKRRTRQFSIFDLVAIVCLVSAILMLFIPEHVVSLRIVAVCSCFISAGVASLWNAHRTSLSLKKALRTISNVLSRVMRKGSASRTLLRESGVFQRPDSVSADPLAEGAAIGNASGLVDSVQRGISEIVRLYELLTTNIAASVVILDDRRRVTFCSAFTEYLTGFTTEELLASETDTLLNIVVDEDRERYLRAWNVSRLGEDIHVRYQMTHKSGLRLWLETRFVPIANEHGEVIAVMSVTMDLTDTLTYQKQIEEKNRDLQDFAYMVSHDLKAPIFTIKGMANALEEDYQGALGNDGRELLQFIIDGADRLEKLVASVLQYSRLATQNGKELELELQTILRQVTQDFGQQIKDSQAVLHIDAELPIVKADPVRLYQVFSNLVGNAIKYRADTRPLEIWIRCKRATHDKVLVEVADNGSGIPAGKVADVFRPFHRAHGSEIEGSGIGLACVRKIVESYGGTVAVRSEEGKGSVFSVTLPSLPPKPQSIPEELARVYE